MGLICNKFEDTMYLRLKNSIKKASEIYINVSFIRDSGMKLLIEDLKNAELKGTKIKKKEKN